MLIESMFNFLSLLLLYFIPVCSTHVFTHFSCFSLHIDSFFQKHGSYILLFRNRFIFPKWFYFFCSHVIPFMPCICRSFSYKVLCKKMSKILLCRWKSKGTEKATSLFDKQMLVVGGKYEFPNLPKILKGFWCLFIMILFLVKHLLMSRKQCFVIV